MARFPAHVRTVGSLAARTILVALAEHYDIDSSGTAPPRGKQACLVPVTVAGPDPSHQWSIEVLRGVVDAPVVLTAGTPPNPSLPPASAKEVIALHVTDAHLGADSNVQLRLDFIDGSPAPATIDMAPGDQAILRLRGRGFSRADTYRATLTVAGTAYSLRLVSTAPYEPLGLRASELQATRSDVPILGERSVAFTASIPVDSAMIAGGVYHVAVKPPDHPAVGAQRLPVSGITVTPDGANSVKISFPSLEAGQYQGIVEIQGEPVVVDLTLKNGWGFVVLLVATGACLSFAGRGYLNYRLAKERNKNVIRAAESKYEKVKSAITWNDSIRNGLRRARGSTRVLGMDDIGCSSTTSRRGCVPSSS